MTRAHVEETPTTPDGKTVLGVGVLTVAGTRVLQLRPRWSSRKSTLLSPRVGFLLMGKHGGQEERQPVNTQ